MEHVIGILVTIIGIVIANKMKVLNSTKNIFGFFIWIFLGWIYMNSVLYYNKNAWGILIFVGLTVMAIFNYFKNKKIEQAILNTVNYMINQEDFKTISVSYIIQKLDYYHIDDMVEKTLKIYKDKALIPYNIDLVS